MNKKDGYLEYVRLLYEREVSRGAQSGVTKWGILIAIVYMMWSFIDSYSTIRDVPLAIQSAVLLYGFTQLALFFITNSLINKSRTDHNSKFDFRIRGNGFSFLPNVYVSLILLLVLPFISFYFRDTSIYQTTSTVINFIEFQSKLNMYVLGFLAIFVATFTLLSQVYESRKGYPSPIMFLVLAQDNRSRGIGVATWSIVSNLLIAVVGFGSAVSAYLIISTLPLGSLKGILTCSFDAALVVLAINYLLSLDLKSERLERISALERDIVFHDLSEDEVKTRVQDELIGQEFGNWLQNKLIGIKRESTLLIDIANDAKKLLIEVQGLPKEFVHERRGRIDDFINELESAFKKYTDEFAPLTSWYKAILSSRWRFKPHVMHILSEIFEEVEAINALTADKTNIALRQLRDIL